MELVVVILLLSILSVFAMGKLLGPDQFAAKGFFDDTRNAVRFAQKLAISTGCKVRVQTTTSSYALHQSSTCIAGDFTLPVKNPANRSNDYQNASLPSGFTLTATAATIVFNARGTLVSGANNTFSVGPYIFTVYGQTGLVD